MRKETIEEFLARGGQIKKVCEGGADRIAANIHNHNSRYHFGERLTIKEVTDLAKQGTKVLSKASRSKWRKILYKEGKNV